MSPYDFHVFVSDSCYYLIDAYTMKVEKISPEIAEGLQNLIDKPKHEGDGEILCFLRTRNLAEKGNPARNPYHTVYHNTPSKLTLMVSQQCNLNCSYCFGGAGEYGDSRMMTPEMAARAVDWFFANADLEMNLEISLFGGEPLLNFDVVKFIITYSRERLSSLSPKGRLDFVLVTNGTLFDKEKADFLNDNNVFIKISLDGDRKAHDRCRTFANGKGSYDAIVDKLPLFKENMSRVAGRITVGDNDDPSQAVAHLKSLGFVRIETQMTTYSEISTVKPYRRSAEALSLLAEQNACSLNSAIKEQNDELILMLWKSSGLGDFLVLFHTGKRRHFYCSAGYKILAISAVGDIYPCPNFIGMDEFRIGSILDGRFDNQAFIKSQVCGQATCTRCFARYFCGGWCFYDNLMMTGNADQPPVDACMLMKRKVELSAVLYASFDAADIAYLEGLGVFPCRV